MNPVVEFMAKDLVIHAMQLMDKTHPEIRVAFNQVGTKEFELVVNHLTPVISVIIHKYPTAEMPAFGDDREIAVNMAAFFYGNYPKLP